MIDFIKWLEFEVLFWAHLIIWLPVLILPFVVPINFVISFVIVYELHLIVLKGCVFTKIQQKIGILPRWLEYYTAICARLFNFRLTGRHVYYITKLTEAYMLIAGMLLAK